jgi:hypothetical protein
MTTYVEDRDGAVVMARHRRSNAEAQHWSRVETSSRVWQIVNFDEERRDFVIIFEIGE